MDAHAAIAPATEHVIGVAAELREELRTLVDSDKEIEVEIGEIVGVALLAVLSKDLGCAVIDKGDEAVLLGIALSADIEVESRAIVGLGMRDEVDLMFIAKESCIAGGIDLAIVVRGAAVLLIENDSIVGVHIDIVAEVEEVGVMDDAIESHGVTLAVVNRMMREADSGAIHEDRVVNIIGDACEWHDHAYAVRFGLDSDPCELLPAKDMDMA